MIRAVTIDAHGVLLLPDPEAIRAVLKEFSIEPSDATCWESHYRVVRLLDLMTEPDWPTMNRSFAEALGVLSPDREAAGTILAATVYLGTSWVAAPGAARALARLTSNGFGAAIVSNTIHGELAQILTRTKMCSVGGEHVRVAAIIDSRTIGSEKPDPRPFTLALNALNETAESCAHVGDSLNSDVVGALGAGMTPIHIDPLNLCDDHRHEHSHSFKDFVADLVF